MTQNQTAISKPEPAGRNAFGDSFNRWWLDGDKVMLELPNYYNIFSVLGQGAYGCVVAASVQVSKSSQETVAVKKFFDPFAHIIHARRTVRELRFLRCLHDHENIVCLRTVTCSGPSRENMQDIYVVTEVMDTDLCTVIRSCQPFSAAHAMFFLYQVLRGLKYIHSAGIIHRDLKPKNLLVNKSCDLKICDFGMARLASGFDGRTTNSAGTNPMTEYVCTRWYRAPELLCCWQEYTYMVDIWSVGCILAEMLTRKCLFKGKSTMDQLKRIQAILGKPTEEEINKIPNAKARAYLHSQQKRAQIPFDTALGMELPQNCLPMLQNTLQFDPDQRKTCVELLREPYLDDLHEESDEPTREPVPTSLFEFERRRVGAQDLEEEVFREMLEFHPDSKAGYLATSSFNICDCPLIDPLPEGEEEEIDDQEHPQEDEDVGLYQGLQQQGSVMLEMPQ